MGSPKYKASGGFRYVLRIPQPSGNSIINSFRYVGVTPVNMAAEDSAGIQEFPQASFAVPSRADIEESVALAFNVKDGQQSSGQSSEDPYTRAVKYVEKHHIVEVFQVTMGTVLTSSTSGLRASTLSPKPSQPGNSKTSVYMQINNYLLIPGCVPPNLVLWSVLFLTIMLATLYLCRI